MDDVNPEVKQIRIPVVGHRFEAMVGDALIEGAAFLGMDVADLVVVACTPAIISKWSRFNGDLSSPPTPEEFQMVVTVGANSEKDTP